MSTQEHYFENLLYAFKRGGFENYEKCKEHDLNIEYLSSEEKAAIEICAYYVLDCCEFKQDNVTFFLNGNGFFNI